LAHGRATAMRMRLSTQQGPDLVERIGGLSSVGPTSEASGQFSLQSRLQMRDLRGRIDDAKDQMQKAAGLLLSKLPEQLQPWADKYAAVIQVLETQLKAIDDGVFGGSIQLKPEAIAKSIDTLTGSTADLRRQSLAALTRRRACSHASSHPDLTPI
ncbi:methyl-accepting chemotaxis protein, partial [Pseudomonas syringae]